MRWRLMVESREKALLKIDQDQTHNNTSEMFREARHRSHEKRTSSRRSDSRPDEEDTGRYAEASP